MFYRLLKKGEMPKLSLANIPFAGALEIPENGVQRRARSRLSCHARERVSGPDNEADPCLR